MKSFTKSDQKQPDLSREGFRSAIFGRKRAEAAREATDFLDLGDCSCRGGDRQRATEDRRQIRGNLTVINEEPGWEWLMD